MGENHCNSLDPGLRSFKDGLRNFVRHHHGLLAQDMIKSINMKKVHMVNTQPENFQVHMVNTQPENTHIQSNEQKFTNTTNKYDNNQQSSVGADNNLNNQHNNYKNNNNNN